jgi:hypothetical protein
MDVIHEVAHDVLNALAAKYPNDTLRLLSDDMDAGVVTLLRAKLREKGFQDNWFPSAPKKAEQILEVFRAVFMYAKLHRQVPMSNGNLENGPANQPDGPYDIVSFLYYSAQSHATHALKDTLAYIRAHYGKQGYLDYVTGTCRELLAMYVGALQDASQRDGFAAAVMALMRDRVFRLRDACKNLPSGYNVSMLKTEFLNDY